MTFGRHTGKWEFGQWSHSLIKLELDLRNAPNQLELSLPFPFPFPRSLISRPSEAELLEAGKLELEPKNPGHHTGSASVPRDPLTRQKLH
jgi:hypothetical protein